MRKIYGVKISLEIYTDDSLLRCYDHIGLTADDGGE